MTVRSAERAQMQALLREYNEHPEDRRRILEELDRQFSQTLALLVIDSCGFSRTVRAHGIVPFLARLERLERLARPVIAACGGRLLRTEADNLFVVFPDADSAVRCADRLLSDLGAGNELLPSSDETHVSMGIGYGPGLLVGEDDFFGDEMNVACKLGEDLAEEDELLISEEAARTLNPASWALAPREFTVSGLSVRAYKLERVDPRVRYGSASR